MGVGVDEAARVDVKGAEVEEGDLVYFGTPKLEERAPKKK